MKGIIIGFCILILCMYGSCTQKHNTHYDDSKNEVSIDRAIAVIHPTENGKANGLVKFVKQGKQVLVKVSLHGLKPGKHGFHVHEFGDISGADGKKTGGHFNPTGDDHSAQDATKRHIGDLGNITADENGNVSVEFLDSKISLNGQHSIIGRGLIVHADEDDLQSQPTGAAGARVGQGVIGIAKKE